MTDWGDEATVLRVISDLQRAVDAGPVAPNARGEYVWRIGEREWTAVVWTGPDGRVQTPRLPGVYLDDRGAARFNVPELCSIVELERTPENLAAVAGLLDRVARSAGLRSAGPGLSDG